MYIALSLFHDKSNIITLCTLLGDKRVYMNFEYMYINALLVLFFVLYDKYPILKCLILHIKNINFDIHFSLPLFLLALFMLYLYHFLSPFFIFSKHVWFIAFFGLFLKQYTAVMHHASCITLCIVYVMGC